MAATETPITELTPVYTDPAVLQGKAVLVHNPTTGDGIVFDASKLDPSEKYQKPSTGIPKTDLAEGVKGSLEKADTSLQPVETATEDNLASFDNAGKIKDSGIPSTKIPEIESKVQTLGNSAGVAEGIADSISAGTAQEITFRKSGGDGVNYMKAIKGKTLAWNQLFVGNQASYTNLGITVVAENGKYTISGTATDNGGFALSPRTSTIAGHKYFVGVSGNHNFNALSWRILDMTNPHNAIFTETANTVNVNLVISVTAGQSYSASLTYFVVDLTLMFGSGKEPSTVAEFEAMFPDAYYPYNAGTLISNDAESIETVGFNQWDEEIAEGGIDPTTGEDTPVGALRSVNKIPVFPGANYFLHVGSLTGTGIRLFYYDANQAYIGTETPAIAEIKTIPSGVYFIRFHVATSVYGTTYNHDICINLSDTSFNGQYEPYRKSTLSINLDDFFVKDGQGNQVHITGGLKSAGSVYDEIVGNKYVKRVEEVNLGDLSWTVVGGLFNADILKPRHYAADEVLGKNIICSRYNPATVISWDAMPDKTIGCTTAVRVNDTAYTDATSFKTAMSGVMLYYELATPVEYELAEPIPNSILVDELGTEQAIFPTHEDGSPSAPLCTDSNYSISVKNLVAKLNSINNS